MKHLKSIFLILVIIYLSISSASAGYSWQDIEISRVLENGNLVGKNSQIIRIIGLQYLDKFSRDKLQKCHYRESLKNIKKLVLRNNLSGAEDSKITEKERVLPLHFKIEKEYLTEIILRNGWAKMNKDEVSAYFFSRFEKAQKYAQENKLGIWGKCLNDLNWQKIRGNFGYRMSNFKKQNPQFMGNVAVGEVSEVISGNEFKILKGPIIKLQNVEIPENTNQASNCFRENSRNFLENLILNKKVRIEREEKNLDISEYKLVRNVFLNKKSREISINQKIIEEGFGKSDFFSEIQSKVYSNARGAWAICAKEILNTDFSGEDEEISRETDESCPIKGNISGTKKSPIKTYHTVLSGWYDRLQAEVCFNTEDEANFAGFRKIK